MRSRGGLLLVASALLAPAACASRDDAAPGWVPPASPELLEVYQAVGGGPITELRYTGLGAPFRAAIADPALLEPLGAALRGCVDGPRAVVAAWDEAASLGRLVVAVPADRLTCRGEVGPDGVDLLPLAPVLDALGTWRAGLAAGHDGRLSAFDVGLHVADHRGGVTLWLDGPERIRPCVVLDGRERCAAGEPAVRLRLDRGQDRLDALLGR